jgi:hypothetical protein
MLRAPRPAITAAPTYVLSRLLMDLYSPDECTHFLLEHFGDDLVSELTTSPIPAQFFDHVAHALLRRGLAGDELLRRLHASRPHRRDEISRALHSLDGASRTHDENHVHVTISGTVATIRVDQIADIIEMLRTLLEDDSVMVVQIKSGSVKLVLRASDDACRRLAALQELDVERLRRLIKRRTGEDLLALSPDPSPLARDQDRFSRCRAMAYFARVMFSRPGSPASAYQEMLDLLAERSVARFGRSIEALTDEQFDTLETELLGELCRGLAGAA